MRNPFRLWRDLGTGGFFTFQLAVGGNVLAALIHPIFVGLFFYHLIVHGSIAGTNGVPPWLAYVLVAGWIAGYLVMVAVGIVGLKRRGLLAAASAFWLIALHWLMLSFAAWRAVYQFIWDRYRWEKTEHGLARSSRRAQLAKPAAQVPGIPVGMNGGAVDRRSAA
jgi:hypothetical protein